MKFSILLASFISLVSAATELPAINVTGNAFYNTETGERFYIRGVDYQPGGSSNLSDPLADVNICSRDIPIFQDLGLNTIRVYSVDNAEDHSKCMELLADAGIYLILDVNTPGASISRIDPGCSYNADYLQNIFATMDEFSTYSNTLGFFAGNEVINDVDTLFTAPYVKAVVRDMKKYQTARHQRKIPVGYSAADVAQVRLELAEYFNCGNDSDARIDMLGVNDYSWCGLSSYTVSGYKDKVAMYSGFSVPIFLSEFGCNEVVGSRPFTEIGSIYSNSMASVFSGGLVYEYSEEGSHYGLVNISSDGNSVTKLTDFYNLQGQYNATKNPTGNAGAATYNYSPCPTGWNFSINVPDTPSGAQTYFDNGAGSAYGFNADTQANCEADAYYVSTSVSGSSLASSSSSASSPSSSSSSATRAASSSFVASSTSSSSSSAGAAFVESQGLTSVFALIAAGFFM